MYYPKSVIILLVFWVYISFTHLLLHKFTKAACDIKKKKKLVPFLDVVDFVEHSVFIVLLFLKCLIFADFVEHSLFILLIFLFLIY